MSKALGLRKLSNKSNLRGSGASWGWEGVFGGGGTIIQGVSETISSFRVGWCTAGEVQFLFLGRRFLVLAAFSVRGRDWVLGKNSMGF